MKLESLQEALGPNDQHRRTRKNKMTNYVCVLCKGSKILKRRGSAKKTAEEPASRKSGRGVRVTPCIACVLESYSTDEVLAGLRLAYRQPTEKDDVYLVPQVKLSFNYPKGKK